jgi:CheY-like chemotaxis protein
MTLSDEKIAKFLKRDIRTIRMCRRQLGIMKKVGGGLQDVNLQRSVVSAHDVVTAHQGMSEELRKQFYRTQFTNSLYYKNLTEQFTEEEIGFYLEEWAGLCVQFEDIVATEKRQIDEYIKLSILGNRILRNIYSIETEIKILQKEIEEFRAKRDLTNDIEAQEYDRERMDMVHSMNAQSQSIRHNYDRNVEMKNKLLDELNARRKDRVDQLSKKGTTFLSLIQDFRDRQTREKQGKHMELARMAKEKKKDKWRKPIRFPDGSLDCVLLDENSEFPKQDIISTSQECNSIDYCQARPDSRILVIDDESRRQQFFADIFKGLQVDYASNTYKALESLKTHEYDLICLDYDLGLNTKGLEVAEKLVSENICPKAKILVHSMNNEGRKKLTDQLGKRELEIYPFEDIVKNLGEKYAKNSSTSGASESNQPNETEGRAGELPIQPV